MPYNPERETEKKASMVPRPPSGCGVFGCRDKAGVLTIIVHENGRDKAGAFSDFGYTKAAMTGTTNHLRNGIDFVRWIARCDNHHLDDLYHAGKGVRSCIAGTDRITPDDVAAYALAHPDMYK